MYRRRFTAFLLVLVMVVCQFVVPVSGMTKSSGSAQDDFAAAAAKLVQDNWDDNFFSSMILRAGSDVMTLDGVEVEVTPPSWDGDNFMLPILDIAEAVGAYAEVNEKTGDITVITENGVTNHISASTDSSVSINSYALNSSINTVVSSSVTDNGTFVARYANGTSITKDPYVTIDELESALGLSITEHDGTIMITSPYQLKQLIVSAEDGQDLRSFFGESQYITNNKGLYLVQYSSSESARQAHEALKNDPDVKYVSPNLITKISDLPGSGNWGTARIHADLMEDHLVENNMDDEIIVAVIDTGVDWTHPHLAGRILADKGKSFVDYTDDPSNDDHGHGTHISGTIVDCTPDNVKILPLKTHNKEGNGAFIAILNAMEYAVASGASVINMSFTGYDDEPEYNFLEEAILGVIEAGVIPVIAAGNEWVDIEAFGATPARMKEGITVSACDKLDRATNFTNYGDAVDICAPGEDILSSVPGGRYEYWSGTSMAAPHVVSAVAMLLAEDSSLGMDEIKEELKHTVSKAGMTDENGHDRVYGYGLLDFRLRFGQTVAPTNIRFRAYDGETTVPPLMPSVLGDLKVYQGYTRFLVHPMVDPYNNETFHNGATDRSFSVESTDPEVAMYKDMYIVAGKPGVATLTFTSNANPNLKSTAEVTVLESMFWVDYAAESYAGGTGTADDPYLISNAEELAKLLYDVIKGNPFGQLDRNNVIIPSTQSYFKMTADIDLDGKWWTPIEYLEPLTLSGSWRLHVPFQGNFDGGGFVISNMTIPKLLHPRWGFSYNQFVGFFGQANYSTIKNLGIVNADVSQGKDDPADKSDCVVEGVLIGQAWYSDISSCYTTGFSMGAGFIDDVRMSTITDCFANVNAKKAGFCETMVSSYAYNCYTYGDMASKNSVAFVNTSSYNSDFPYGGFFSCFSAAETLSGTGFIGARNAGIVDKCYYLQDNPNGIAYDYSSQLKDLTPKSAAFFRDIESYDDANWSADHPWDFENTWAIDPDVNDGLPYLKNLTMPPEKDIKVDTGTWLDYAAGSFDGGDGTKDNPYQIATAAQLARLAKRYMYGGADNMFFILTDDIDLAGHDWYPIAKGDGTDLRGTPSDRESFSGYIFGNGKTISNMTVSGTGDNLGLISYLKHGGVENLTLENARVNGNNNVGALVGYSTYTKISNCAVISGNITGNSMVGGLVGYNLSGSEIRGSSAAATITGNATVGGLCGANDMGTLEYCSANVVFVNVNANSGALTYRNRGTIANCYAFDNRGGSNARLVYSGQNTFGKIENCYYVGDGVQYYYGLERTTSPGTSKTTEQMKDLATYADWDFENVWNIDLTGQTNDGYPYLKLPVTVEVLPGTFWKDYAADTYAGGDGSAIAPYLIETPEQLAKMWVDYSTGNGVITARYYELVNDIDLSGRLWMAIGSGMTREYVPSRVNFDGKGHEIQNMTLHYGTQQFNNGLFNTVFGTIQNLGLTDISGYGNGGIAYQNEGTIQNCYVTGSVACSNSAMYAAGLVGFNFGTIENCYADVDVTGGLSGGAVGFSAGTVKNCYALGKVTAAAVPWGYGNGGAFMYFNGGTLANCYAAAEVIGSGNGFMNGGEGQNCYYDVNVASNGVYTYNYARTTEQMKDQATYVGWDFDNVWYIHPMVNNGYPYLISMVDTEGIINYVTAANGSLEVVFIDEPQEELDLSDFTVTYSINGGEEAVLGITSLSVDGPVYTMEFDTLPYMTYEQNVVISVALNTSAMSGEFVIEAAQIVSVIADNATGKLTITFDHEVANIPEEDEFIITWGVGWNPNDEGQALSNYVFEGDTATFDFIPYLPCGADQYVTFTVTFGELTLDSNTIIVDKWTMLEEVEIVYLTPGMVTVTKSKTIQLSVETDPYVDVTQFPYSMTWKSLMPTIVSVNQSGLVTGKAVGMGLVQAIITDPYGAEIVITFSVQVK